MPFSKVHVADKFWSSRLETSRTVTIPYCFAKCEETDRISNFEKAAGQKQGEFKGIFFNDSDVYKIMEGAAYTLQVKPDPKMRTYLDRLIGVMAAAQWEDGYLYTFYSVPQAAAGKALDEHRAQSRAILRGTHVRSGRRPLSGDRRQDVPRRRPEKRRPDLQHVQRGETHRPAGAPGNRNRPVQAVSGDGR